MPSDRADSQRVPRVLRLPSPEMTHVASDAAWMSVRDADILLEILLQVAEARQRPTIIEWGAGRSTMVLSRLLRDAGHRFRWLSLEHDRAFFEQEIRAFVESVPWATESAAGSAPDFDRHELVAVPFDSGRYRPFEWPSPVSMGQNLGGYVSYPARHGMRVDLAVIDGRWRRACTEQAIQLLRPGGVVLLHDAWRRHYQCAFANAPYGRRLGDEFWAGSRVPLGNIVDLPDHCYERPEDPCLDGRE